MQQAFHIDWVKFKFHQYTMGISGSEKCINKNGETQNIAKKWSNWVLFFGGKWLNNEKNDCLGNDR